jgi:molybdopterin-binding protein
MRISARNQLKGKILEVKIGCDEAVDELGLKAGGTATAVIKASDVMIAID